MVAVFQWWLVGRFSFPNKLAAMLMNIIVHANKINVFRKKENMNDSKAIDI